jgi:hypothetical protein
MAPECVYAGSIPALGSNDSDMRVYWYKIIVRHELVTVWEEDMAAACEHSHSFVMGEFLKSYPDYVDMKYEVVVFRTS